MKKLFLVLLTAVLFAALAAPDLGREQAADLCLGAGASRRRTI